MKVSAYYPVFYCEDLDAEAKRYVEDLGFTIRHRTEVKNFEYIVLENNGTRIDLAHVTLPFSSSETGFYGMRVNVDNFDEGVEYFKGRGLIPEGAARESASSISQVMIGRDGSRVIIFHHKK